LFSAQQHLARSRLSLLQDLENVQIAVHYDNSPFQLVMAARKPAPLNDVQQSCLRGCVADNAF